MFVDYIQNGQGHGPIGSMLAGTYFDPGYSRPFFDRHGRQCATVRTGRMVWNEELGFEVPEKKTYLLRDLIRSGRNSPVFNATTLRKLEWAMWDQKILRAARLRLRAWADLAASNTFGGFNGMSKLLLEHETMADVGEAEADMDGVTEPRDDELAYQLQGLPLPIFQSGFRLTARRLAASRNSGTPLDSTRAEMAGRRVAELIEQTCIGVTTGVTYGGTNNVSYGRTPTVYGYTNFPLRLIYNTLHIPTDSAWNAGKTLGDVLAMRDTLLANRFYGPYMIYHSTDWDKYMDNDYILTGGNVATQTLRNRLRQIEGVQDVRRLDFLNATSNPFTLLMVQMTQEVARAVNGMDITTLQWETKGSMELNFKVMAIQVPQLRADYYGRCGILHATTS
jgi:hypothetical protein